MRPVVSVPNEARSLDPTFQRFLAANMNGVTARSSSARSAANRSAAAPPGMRSLNEVNASANRQSQSDRRFSVYGFNRSLQDSLVTPSPSPVTAPPTITTTTVPVPTTTITTTTAPPTTTTNQTTASTTTIQQPQSQTFTPITHLPANTPQAQNYNNNYMRPLHSSFTPSPLPPITPNTYQHQHQHHHQYPQHPQHITTVPATPVITYTPTPTPIANTPNSTINKKTMCKKKSRCRSKCRSSCRSKSRSRCHSKSRSRCRSKCRPWWKSYVQQQRQNRCCSQTNPDYSRMPAPIITLPRPPPVHFPVPVPVPVRKQYDVPIKIPRIIE